MTTSIGARARDTSREAAKMPPAEIFCSIASHAPRPRASDCSTSRQKRVAAM